jgi:hypothetical protein
MRRWRCARACPTAAAVRACGSRQVARDEGGEQCGADARWTGLDELEIEIGVVLILVSGPEAVIRQRVVLGLVARRRLPT